MTDSDLDARVLIMPPKDQAAVREEIKGIGLEGELGFGSDSWSEDCDLGGEVGVVWGSEGSGSSSEKTDLKKFMAENWRRRRRSRVGFVEEFWRSGFLRELTLFQAKFEERENLFK